MFPEVMIPSRQPQSLKKHLQSTEATSLNIILKYISLHTTDCVTSNLSSFLLQITDVSGREFQKYHNTKGPIYLINNADIFHPSRITS